VTLESAIWGLTKFIDVFFQLIDGYEPTKSLLVEEFCEGVPIMEFIRHNNEDRELLSAMCRGAIHAVCQMIFLDNFVHGTYFAPTWVLAEICRQTRQAI
jgi:hypothetical protein